MQADLTGPMLHFLARRRALRFEALTWRAPRVSTRTRGDLAYHQPVFVDNFQSENDVKKFRFFASKLTNREVYSASWNGLVAGSPEVNFSDSLTLQC